MKSRDIFIIAFITIASFMGIEKAFSQVVVKVKPVRPIEVAVKPAKAHKKHVWVEGHWIYSYKFNKYVWVKGKWVKRPRGKARWVQGHWRKAPGGWKYVPGHWS